MKKKRTLISLVMIAVLLMIAVFAFVACGDPADDRDPYVVDGDMLTVNKAGTVRYEAENADVSHYKISSDNATTVVEREDASDGKFLAAATGSVDDSGSNYFRFTLDLQFPAEIEMKAAYAQTESKKGNAIDMTKAYKYLIDENFSVALTENDNMLAAREDITEWDEITYDTYTLAKGKHSFRVFVVENTGLGNPNIDYIEFNITEVNGGDIDGVSVPANDFHTPVQYAYLNDEDCRNVHAYAKGAIELSIPDPIMLDYSKLGNSASYVVEYADNAAFANSVIVEDVTTKQYGIYNLELGQDLYWRAAKTKDALAKSKVKGNMTIAEQGPRNLYVDGVSNVRDIGGYESDLFAGAKIKQGLYYRGANLESITDAGKAEMQRLGIKSEIDLRDSNQCKGPYVDNIDYYPIPIPSGTEPTRFEQFAAEYKKIFTIIAHADEAPVYLHCTAGADRTGISSFMLLTVCGASYENIVQDYVFTNFSVQGARYLENEFDNWWSKLDNFAGETKADKAKAWLMSKGITNDEVEKIREIFVPGYDATYDGSGISNLPEPVKPAEPEQPIVRPADPVFKIADAGEVVVEAEKVNLGGEKSEAGKYANWPTAAAYNDIAIQSDANASGGKFLAAATGGKDTLDTGSVYLTFVIDLAKELEVTMSGLYAQTKSAVPNLRFTVTVDGKTVSTTDRMTNKGVGVWQEIKYSLGTVKAGKHTVKLLVSYDTANQGNPNIDCFKFVSVVPGTTPVEPEPQPPVIKDVVKLNVTNATATIDKEGDFRFEAEEAKPSDNYKTAGDYTSIGNIITRADASNGKFLAAPTGNAPAGMSVDLVLKLEMDADVTMSAAFVQADSKLGTAQNISDTFKFLIVETNQELSVSGNNVLAAREDKTEWQEFTFNKVTLPLGTYHIKITVRQNTGKGNPNIDYLDFNIKGATVARDLTIDSEGKTRFEAEKANLGASTGEGTYANWLTAGAYSNIAVQSGTASGDKFLAAATGGKDNLDKGLVYLTFTVKLDFDAYVTLTGAYAQIKDAVPNLTFTVTVGQTVVVANGKMTNKGVGVWQEIDYTTLKLLKGTYTVKLLVNYDAANQGNPNIDYFDFDVKKSMENAYSVDKDNNRIAIYDNGETAARFEAEDADLGKWEIASIHKTKVVGKGDVDKNDKEVAAANTASGEKFVAAATGDKGKCGAGLYLTFTLDLAYDANVTLSAAYVQSTDKANNTPDISKNFTVTIDGVTVAVSGSGVMSAATDDSAWATFNYSAVALSAGTHTFKLQVNYDTTGQGNPNIDYFDFVAIARA